ncbi:dihydroorotate dehydrogenase [Calorimonas adulescens]|uniref:Dihydroorotate dehydrogenase n=1 Tax=Calorimonas adulescens TaxID=2606906 RepID=A0A5D8QCN9_9THEO|nr:dihydroorotate dehydrogenase [Calorimonas adulescens]TZE82410.1 dihydroorotate dehydrogenase [Calorimonas adulescens]
MNTSVEISGMRLKNPVMNASGTFNPADYEEYIDIGRLGAVVAKSVTLNPRHGNPPPRIVETACGAINSVGIQNDGAENFIAEKLPSMRKFNVPLIASIAGLTVEEYGLVTDIMENGEGIAGYEVNISCPNIEAGGKAFGMFEEYTYKVTRTVKDRATRPVIVKLSPNVADIVKIAKAATDGGADALTIANTYLALAVDIDTGKPLLGNVLGGLSGPAIKPITLRLVYEVRKALDIPIIASGGIATYRDALEYLMVGADAVQVGLMNFNKPDIMIDIIDGIEKFLEAKRIEDINDFIGSLEV